MAGYGAGAYILDVLDQSRAKNSHIPRRFLDMTLNSAGLELVALPLPDAATGRPGLRFAWVRLDVSVKSVFACCSRESWSYDESCHIHGTEGCLCCAVHPDRRPLQVLSRAKRPAQSASIPSQHQDKQA